MPTVVAKVVPEPDNIGTILAPADSPAIEGDGSLDIVCGSCGTLLVVHAQPCLAIRNIVIRCPNCGQYNDTE